MRHNTGTDSKQHTQESHLQPAKVLPGGFTKHWLRQPSAQLQRRNLLHQVAILLPLFSQVATSPLFSQVAALPVFSQVAVLPQFTLGWLNVIAAMGVYHASYIRHEEYF